MGWAYLAYVRFDLNIHADPDRFGGKLLMIRRMMDAKESYLLRYLHGIRNSL